MHASLTRLSTNAVCTFVPLSNPSNISSNDMTRPSADENSNCGESLLEDGDFVHGTDLSTEISFGLNMAVTTTLGPSSE